MYLRCCVGLCPTLYHVDNILAHIVKFPKLKWLVVKATAERVEFDTLHVVLESTHNPFFVWQRPGCLLNPVYCTPILLHSVPNNCTMAVSTSIQSFGPFWHTCTCTVTHSLNMYTYCTCAMYHMCTFTYPTSQTSTLPYLTSNLPFPGEPKHLTCLLYMHCIYMYM